VVPKSALGHNLLCLNWHWGRVCGVAIGTGAGFLVPKEPMRQALWCLKW